MRALARILSGLSAIAGALTLIRIRPSFGVLAGLLPVPKMLAGALAPFVALLGAAGALLGVVSRDRAATLLGLLGAALSARHVRRVTAPHRSFDDALGADWRARIPPSLRARMLARRWSFPMPEPPRVPWQRDVCFGNLPETGEPLLCDLWLPPAGTPRTGLAVIYLHGSAWQYLDKDCGTRVFFRHLAAQGHVVMDVAYTLAPKAQLAGMVGDVKRAIAWMKAHAQDYGVNPERVVLMGGSAGGHLALLAAYAPHHPALQPAGLDADTSVRAVVAYYGFADLVESHRYWLPPGGWLASREAVEAFFRLVARWEPAMRRIGFLPPYGRWSPPHEWMPILLGGTPEEAPESYALGSPISHAGPGCPPTLFLQGAHDLAGMVGQIRRLHQALRAAGAMSIYVELPATDHGFDLFWPRWSPAAQSATFDADRFLALMV